MYCKKNVACFITIFSLLLAFTACSGSAQVNAEHSIKDLKAKLLKLQEKMPEAIMNDEFDAFIEEFDIWEKKYNAFKAGIEGKIVSQAVQSDIDFLDMEAYKINLLKE